MGRRLTETAHAALATALASGDTAIDATAGNGHDTAFLARAVGPGGRVYAFDVQPDAIASTRRRLRADAIDDRVTLIRGGHEALARHVPAALHGRIAGVTFNLGYLPGGERAITTRPANSVAGLEAAAALVRGRAVITVMAYRGHPGGRAEADAIAEACARLTDDGFSIEKTTAPNDGPVLWVLRAPVR